MSRHWSFHPAVRTGDRLSVGERAADRMRATMGSWLFVFGFLGFMAVWMTLNGVGWILHWDIYPYVLLNLCLSCLAGLQGAILLIAAKRADQIAAELARHDYQVNQDTLERIEQMATHLGVQASSGHANGPVGDDRSGVPAP